MIWESCHWKQPLLDMADRLADWQSSNDLSDEALAQIERDIFIGFYSIRKLVEAPTKLTDETRSLTIHLDKYPNLKPVTWRNSHRLDELYDLSKNAQGARDVEFVCGRIIHSFVFAPCQSESGGLHGAFFSSDHDRNKCLYFISTDELISLFRAVGNDDPSDIRWSRDPDTGKETMIVK
jgi:hypothetical protein